MCALFIFSVIIINVKLPKIETMIYEQAGLVRHLGRFCYTTECFTELVKFFSNLILHSMVIHGKCNIIKVNMSDILLLFFNWEKIILRMP